MILVDQAENHWKVINSTEYERIKAQLNAKETAERVRTQKEQEKERLRALSRKQVNSWNNTLRNSLQQNFEYRLLIHF